MNPKGCRGVTLIELLAAIVIAGFVMTLAGKAFLSGNAQFLKRSADSERLASLYRLKAGLGHALRGEVSRCAAKGLYLKDGDGETEILARLRKRFPFVEGGSFRCLEPDAAGSALQEWKDADQPPLVEYRLRVRVRGTADSLVGSWLR